MEKKGSQERGIQKEEGRGEEEEKHLPEEATLSAATTFCSLKKFAGNTMLTGPGLIGALRLIDIVFESDKVWLKVAKGPGALSENEFCGNLSAALDI